MYGTGEGCCTSGIADAFGDAGPGQHGIAATVDCAHGFGEEILDLTIG